MSYSLHLNLSHFLAVDLLDEKLCIIDSIKVEMEKNATQIHFSIYEICKRNNVEVKEIKNVFGSLGPGSYTGVRLVGGILKVFKWYRANIYQYYDFEIPSFAGIQEYRWISNAYKSELFVYECEKNGKSTRCILPKNQIDLSLFDQGKPSFGHEKLLEIEKFQLIRSLIENRSPTIFKAISGLTRNLETFYYRELEKEFNREKGL